MQKSDAEAHEGREREAAEECAKEDSFAVSCCRTLLEENSVDLKKDLSPGRS